MSTLRFSAHCERGHDPVDFTDPAAFEAHMMGEHGAKKPFAGMATEVASGWSRAKVAAPGWRGGKPLEPTPWVAPKAPTTLAGLTKVLTEYSASETSYPMYLDPDWSTDSVRPVAELEPGDVFTLGKHTYEVHATDPERGWLLRMRRTAAKGGPVGGWINGNRAKPLHEAGTVPVVGRCKPNPEAVAA